MKARRHLTTAAVLAAAGLVSIVPASGAAGPAAHASACVPATNVEAIIDDSGSMAITDPSTLRVKGVKLLISTLPATTTLGAVEFGGSFVPEEPIPGYTPPPAADTVFGPEPVGPNAAAMGSALETKIQADNGSTDYNAAFAQSDADNPTAQARIFLTDGGHNIGTYKNGHLTHKVPTYVIGFSSALVATEDKARLEAIASETGGSFYPLTDSSSIQSVMDSIGAAITCQTPPQSFNDKLKQGASKTHTLTLGASTKSLQIALTWASPLDSFTIGSFKITSHGKLLAKSSRRPRHLSVTTTSSQTFTIVKVTGLVKGKLSFKVKALKVGSGTPEVLLTTQVGKRSTK